MNLLDRVSPYVLLVLTTLFWAGNANLARAFADEIPPVGLAYWRWFLAWLVLLPFVWKPMRQYWQVAKQHKLLVLGSSIFGVACFNTLLYLGLQTTSVTNAVIIQSACPIFIAVLAMFLLQERLNVWQWLGIILSLLGVVVVLVRGDLTLLQSLQFVMGDWVVLLAVMCWAIYTTLLRKLPAELKGLPYLGYSMTIGSWLLLPVYLYTHQAGAVMPFSMVSVVSVLYTALFASILSYLFWNHATSRLGASRAGQFIHLIPFFGILLAMLILGERLQLFHLIGGGLVASGLVLANVFAKREA